VLTIKRGVVLVAVTSALGLGLVGAGTAQASFGVTISGGPAAPQAGAHPNLSLTLTFSGDEKVDDLDLNLPPGLVGDPGSVTICTVAEARGPGCPATSQVGSASAQSTATLLTGPMDAQATGAVYVMEPIGSEPARLWMKLTPEIAGVAAGPPITSESAIRLRSPGDFGLTTLVRDLPDSAELTLYGKVPIKLNALNLTLFGTPPNSPKRPFLSNPNGCGTKTITVDASSKSGSAASAATDPFAITECEKLPFAPQLTAKIGAPAAHPSFTTSVLGTSGESTLAGLQLLLPPALQARLAALQRTCLQAVYAAGNCKPDAVVGSVLAVSPLIPLPLTGPVTLVKLDDQVLPALAMKLTGAFNIDLLVQNASVGGRLQSSINGVPDAPISRFDLTLAADGLLSGDKTALCGTPQSADGTFTSHSGKTTTSTVAVDVSAICGPTKNGTVAAKPVAKAALKGIGRGHSPSLTVRLTGKQTRLTSLRLSVAGTKLTLVGVKAKRLARAVIGGKSSRLTVSGTTLTAKAGSKGSDAIELRVGKGALRKGTLKVGQRTTLKLSYTQAGSKTVHTLKIKVRATR